MGDLSKNLSRREFACKCGCGFDTVDIELVGILQGCVDFFSARTGKRVKIIITSGSRCQKHNREVGGALSSQHLFARAADHKIFVDGALVSVDAVADYYEGAYPGRLGVGRYSNRVHVDNRSDGPARWDTR